MKYFTALLFILLLMHCGDKDPEFNRDLSKSSAPVSGVLPYFKGEIMDPYWPKGAAYPEDLRRMDNFKLISHEAKPFGPERIQGKYTLVNFFFASCHGICPLITHNVKKLSARIKDQSDVQFLSLTVNPERDNSKVISDFREMNKVTQANWTFLTGSKDGYLRGLYRARGTADLDRLLRELAALRKSDSRESRFAAAEH